MPGLVGKVGQHLQVSISAPTTQCLCDLGQVTYPSQSLSLLIYKMGVITTLLSKYRGPELLCPMVSMCLK